jgi:hypothetical protein
VHDAEHHGADPSGAYDTDRLAVKIESHQPVERKVRLSDPVVGAVNPTIERENECDCVLGDGMWRILSDADDSEAKPSGSVEIHVVEPCRAQGNQSIPAVALDGQGVVIEPVVVERADRIEP